MSDRVSSDDSELSDLESVISQDARDNQGAGGQHSRDGWPLSSPTQPSGPLGSSPSRDQGSKQSKHQHQNSNFQNINFLAVDPSVLSSRAGFLAEREDPRNPRRCAGLSSSPRSRYRRLGKDEKLAQEANLPFTVRVSDIQYTYLKERSTERTSKRGKIDLICLRNFSLLHC